MSANLESAVHRAARQLKEETGHVSVRSVRARLGKGSFRDIGQYLATWRTHACYKTDAQKPPQDAITEPPEGVGAISLEKHAQIVAQMANQLEGERRHLMMQTDAIRQGLAAPHLMKIERLEKLVRLYERTLRQAGVEVPVLDQRL